MFTSGGHLHAMYWVLAELYLNMQLFTFTHYRLILILFTRLLFQQDLIDEYQNSARCFRHFTQKHP